MRYSYKDILEAARSQPSLYCTVTTTYAPQAATPAYLDKVCSKCGAKLLTQRHVQVDDNRDCLLLTCHSCGLRKQQKQQIIKEALIFRQ